MGREVVAPRGEIVWERITTKSGLRYLVTSKPTRDLYYLYKIDGSKLSKVGKARTPDALQKYYEEEDEE